MTDQQPQLTEEIQRLQISQQPSTTTVRLLIASREAGLLIGRGGATSQLIRQQTGVQLRVGEQVKEAHERLLTLTAQSRDQLASAIRSIADKQLQYRHEQQEAARLAGKRIYPARSLAGHQLAVDEIELIMLVPHAQMGAVLGRGGDSIKRLQADSGARLAASQELLTNSTDRSVSCQGTAEQVAQAIVDIVAIQQENGGTGRLTGHLSYRPAAGRQDQVGGGGGKNDRPRRQKANSVSASDGKGKSNEQVSDQPIQSDSKARDSGQHKQQESSSNTQTVAIANEMVGAVIGRGGATVRDIRQKSGASVHISQAADAEAKERYLTVSGTQEQCQQALFLVYQKLEEERNKQTDSAND